MANIIPIIVSVVILSFPIPSEMPIVGSRQALKEAVVHVAEAATAPKNEESTDIIRSMWVTAYSSTPDQTDDTPFITAMGTAVRDGIVATNMLPFGTKVKIPKLFGDKVFIVEDRMHPRKKNFLDIWVSSTEAALRIGINKLDVVILN